MSRSSQSGDAGLPSQRRAAELQDGKRARLRAVGEQRRLGRRMQALTGQLRLSARARRVISNGSAARGPERMNAGKQSPSSWSGRKVKRPAYVSAAGVALPPALSATGPAALAENRRDHALAPSVNQCLGGSGNVGERSLDAIDDSLDPRGPEDEQQLSVVSLRTEMRDQKRDHRAWATRLKAAEIQDDPFDASIQGLIQAIRQTRGGRRARCSLECDVQHPVRPRGPDCKFRVLDFTAAAPVA